ncbi:LysE family transporter [Kosmotoga pacifica]|uniref:Amino acid transporter LysE n=1 Tax=Kosmotoga pacifica TaxID=1330330 RepID=A0A0G2Z802_9BACT|nr:LysE family transporter [Kosmotoga pacifica]AKI97687.1 amino acid transporter LysE [Kosmotoga pacifica]
MFPLFPFLAYVFTMTFTPGPNNIMSMANANRFGYRKTLNFLLGVVSGFFTILLLSGLFNLALENIMPGIQLFMNIFGGLYIGYLGISVIIDRGHRTGAQKHLNNYLVGFSMQFANPKGILFGITIMANFIIPYYKSSISLILFSAFLTFVAFISVSCWALFGVLFQRFLSRYGKAINITLGLLLIYSAVSISGIMKFIKL